VDRTVVFYTTCREFESLRARHLSPSSSPSLDLWKAYNSSMRCAPQSPKVPSPSKSLRNIMAKHISNPQEPWNHRYPSPPLPSSPPTKPLDPLHHPLQHGDYVPALFSNHQFRDKGDSRYCEICKDHRSMGPGWVMHKFSGWICMGCKDTEKGTKYKKITQRDMQKRKSK
jgi:hypothetical protein